MSSEKFLNEKLLSLICLITVLMSPILDHQESEARLDSTVNYRQPGRVRPVSSQEKGEENSDQHISLTFQ